MQMNMKIDFYRSLNLTNFAANLYVLPFRTDKSVIVISFRRLLMNRTISYQYLKIKRVIINLPLLLAFQTMSQ